MRCRQLIALLLLAACGPRSDGVAEAPEKVVIEVFMSALQACSSVSPEGIDIAESGLHATGWTPRERIVTRNAQRRVAARDRPAKLQAGEIETATWRLGDKPGELYVTRGGGINGRCMLDLQTADGNSRNTTAAFERHFGRKPDLAGARPQGGDFIMPRRSEEIGSRYWRLPSHDVYLEQFEGGALRIEVVAMPDRSALDPYSGDSPTSRIYVEGTN